MTNVFLSSIISGTTNDLQIGRLEWKVDAHCLHSKKSPTAFMDGRGLLFQGEFVTSVNVYNSSPEGATICITLKEGINATAVLQHYICLKSSRSSAVGVPWRRRNLLVLPRHISAMFNNI